MMVKEMAGGHERGGRAQKRQKDEEEKQGDRQTERGAAKKEGEDRQGETEGQREEGTRKIMHIKPPV